MQFDALREVRARTSSFSGSTQAWTEIDELSAPSKWSLLSNSIQESELIQAVAVLRSADVEPILLKGWGVARLYPRELSRPLGDIDVLVGNDQLQSAANAIRQHHDTLSTVDLHRDGAAAVLPFAVLLDRSELHPLQGIQIRVPCYEHQLNIVGVHMLRHGAWRPLWLVDVAVLLDGRSASFDWDLCLGRQKTVRNWILTALVLAHRLFGSCIRGTPAEQHCIPDWLVPEVLRRWEHPDPAEHQPPESIFRTLAHPWRLPAVLQKRWPDPISAVISNGREFPAQRPSLLYRLQYMAQLVNSRIWPVQSRGKAQ